MAEKKDIYYNGRIYVGLSEQEIPMLKYLEWETSTTHYPVTGTHSFKDRQEVTGMYELKRVCNAPYCDCKNGIPLYCRINSQGKQVATLKSNN